MKRIMVVEDDEDITSIINLFLTENEFDVIESVPELVFNNAIKDKPDLILLDVWLSSRHTGDSICQKLKSDSITKGIPVVLVSAIADLNAVAISCKADGYLEKPFDLEVLLAVVHQFTAKA